MARSLEVFRTLVPTHLNEQHGGHVVVRGWRRLELARCRCSGLTQHGSRIPLSVWHYHILMRIHIREPVKLAFGENSEWALGGVDPWQGLLICLWSGGSRREERGDCTLVDSVNDQQTPKHPKHPWSTLVQP